MTHYQSLPARPILFPVMAPLTLDLISLNTAFPKAHPNNNVIFPETEKVFSEQKEKKLFSDQTSVHFLPLLVIHTAC